MIRRSPRSTPYRHTLALHDARPLLRSRRWNRRSSDQRSAAEAEEGQEEARCREGDRQAEHDLDQLAETAARFAERQCQPGNDDNDDRDDLGDRPLHRFQDLLRSEEHTSELQSLMRISYAVFCLKKKQ